MKVFTVILFFQMSMSILIAQETNATLSFQLLLNTSKSLEGKGYYLFNGGNSIQVETFKFYISSIAFYDGRMKVWEEQNSFHLIDFTQTSTIFLSLKVPKNLHYTQLKFQLGIDSITNVSGALGGDLDPTKGMYWTWQSGYINLKLEGKCSACNSRKNEFQFHLGGYQYPTSCLQSVDLAAHPQDSTAIIFDLKMLLSEIDFSHDTHIMSPGKEALELSQKAAKAFYIKP